MSKGIFHQAVVIFFMPHGRRACQHAPVICDEIEPFETFPAVLGKGEQIG